MTEMSYFWGGVIIGDAVAAPYSDDEFSYFMHFIATWDRVRQGVLPYQSAIYTGMLSVTNPVGTTLRVNPGVALVDGKLYTSDAAVDFVAAGVSQFWLVGLIKNFAAQTVRLFARGGYASEVAALAALVQTDSVTWEIALATVELDGAGAVVAVTDQRHFVGTPSSFLCRRLGDITDPNWNASGNIIYNVLHHRQLMQAGAEHVHIPNGNIVGTTTITFPIPYDYVPLVYLTIIDVDIGIGTAVGVVHLIASMISSTITQLVVDVECVIPTTADAKIYFNWLAIGPSTLVIAP